MLLHFQDHKTFTKTRRFWPKYSRSSLRLYSPSSKCDGAFFFVFSKLPKHPIPRCYWCYLRCNKLALKWSGIGFQLLSYLYPSVVGAAAPFFIGWKAEKGGTTFPLLLAWFNQNVIKRSSEDMERLGKVSIVNLIIVEKSPLAKFGKISKKGQFLLVWKKVPSGKADFLKECLVLYQTKTILYYSFGWYPKRK